MRFLPLIALCCAFVASGSSIVTNCSESELDAALASGGQVTFACNGVIYFTATKTITNEVVLDAGNRSITLSGSNSVRLFAIGPSGSLEIKNVTIAHGSAVVAGGPSGIGGGAISNGGTLSLQRCLVVSNSVRALSSGFVYGGAIINEGLLYADECMFQWNECIGGNGTNGIGFPGDGQNGGIPLGGAIANRGEAFITNSTLAFNKVSGGHAGNGSIAPFVGHGGHGGFAGGGAAATTSGILFFFNSTIASNLAIGGNGGLAGSPVHADRHDGIGGGAIAALWNGGGGVRLENSTVAGNRPVFGIPRTNDFYTNTYLQYASLSGHAYLQNTIVQSSQGSNNLSGAVVDGGNNLCSDNTCELVQPTSLNNTEARLLPLAHNGGETLTMLPSPGSPAIDAGAPENSLPRDQRGHPRVETPDIGAVELQSPRIIGPNIVAGRFLFNLELENGIPWVVESSESVEGTAWTMESSVTTTNRASTFQAIVPDGEPKRFYRVRSE